MTRPEHHRSHPNTEVDNEVDTPALVWDLDVLDGRVRALRGFADAHASTLYFSVKASGVIAVLNRIAPMVAGFSCSSPFEAQLARDIIGPSSVVSMTSPALTHAQCSVINQTCDHVSFNSLSQMERVAPALAPSVEQGIRINPGFSIVEDPRYDPARENSKLGIPIDQLLAAYEGNPGKFTGISGVHIHTACGNRTFNRLIQTMELIEAKIPALLQQVRWFNLGGGYAFDKVLKSTAFGEAVARLRSHFDMDVIIEPGTSMVQNAARVVTSVVDIFKTKTAIHAVLDTSVNHMPEVFAYQFQPPVRSARRDAGHTYILSGATCLAGDIFGTYSFDRPLTIGQRLAIEKAGAYTHGQSHWFNGINLPAIYSHSVAGGLSCEREFTFEDFASRCGSTR